MSAPDTVLTIGDFTFSGLEIPERINFGGDQALAIHQMIGGARVIDAMGRIDAPLSWSGLIFGSKADERARYLDGLRITGKPVKLSYGAFHYLVIVRQFIGQWERFYQIPYTITLEVVQDLTTATTAITNNGPDGFIQADMKTANGLGSLIGDGPLSTLLIGLDAAIGTVSDFAKSGQSVLASVLTPLAAVQARVGILISSTGNLLGSASTLGGLLPYNPIANKIAQITGQITGVQSMPPLYQLQSVLGRMGANIGTIGASGQHITMAGGDLYSMASQQYGNAAAWPTIADANGISDPYLSGINTLTIPSVPTVTNGIPN